MLRPDRSRLARLGALLAAACLTFACLSTPALASTLDDARAAGTVGEQPDGYIGAVAANPPADVLALVTEVNTKRRAAYQKIATDTGAPIEAVAARAAKKLLAKVPSGQYLRKPTGEWMKQP